MPLQFKKLDDFIAAYRSYAATVQHLNAATIERNAAVLSALYEARRLEMYLDRAAQTLDADRSKFMVQYGQDTFNELATAIHQRSRQAKEELTIATGVASQFGLDNAIDFKGAPAAWKKSIASGLWEGSDVDSFNKRFNSFAKLARNEGDHQGYYQDAWRDGGGSIYGTGDKKAGPFAYGINPETGEVSPRGQRNPAIASITVTNGTVQIVAAQSDVKRDRAGSVTGSTLKVSNNNPAEVPIFKVGLVIIREEPGKKPEILLTRPKARDLGDVAPFVLPRGTRQYWDGSTWQDARTTPVAVANRNALEPLFKTLVREAGEEAGVRPELLPADRVKVMGVRYYVANPDVRPMPVMWYVLTLDPQEIKRLDPSPPDAAETRWVSLEEMNRLAVSTQARPGYIPVVEEALKARHTLPTLTQSSAAPSLKSTSALPKSVLDGLKDSQVTGGAQHEGDPKAPLPKTGAGVPSHGEEPHPGGTQPPNGKRGRVPVKPFRPIGIR